MDMPMPRDQEITRPITVDPMGPRGATLEQFAQLDAGEIPTLLVDRYQLGRCLGKGGMSSVYEGEHVAGGVSVAIKLLTRDLTAHPNALARFLNEAQLTAKVVHPNVVEVLDFGTTPEGLAYLVMPMYEGEDLRTTLRHEGPLSWPRARTLLVQLCAALEAVHDRAIVHRDVKPSNCLLVIEDGEERIKLLDFGVARKIDDSPEESVVGTPEYMSPEQSRGDTVDARSDIYSLGIVLGELLTGRVPFDGDSVSAVLVRHEYERPPILAELAAADTVLPYGIDVVYQRALAKCPTQRYATVGEFAAALTEITDERDCSSHCDPASRWKPMTLHAGLALGGLVSL
jgi:eukaryotic-like serine/threonine-protein kinase